MKLCKGYFSTAIQILLNRCRQWSCGQTAVEVCAAVGWVGRCQAGVPAKFCQNCRTCRTLNACIAYGTYGNFAETLLVGGRGAAVVSRAWAAPPARGGRHPTRTPRSPINRCLCTPAGLHLPDQV